MIAPYSFRGNTRLEEIVIPEGVRGIGGASFYGDSTLKKIVIPNSVTAIGNLAFGECPNLKLYGYEGSYIQTYALENSIPFIVINDK